MNFPEKAVLGPDMISTEKEIRECVTQSLGSLQSIWADMGVHGEAKVERLQSFRNHVLKLLQEMVEEEESYKLLIVHRIEQHMENICKLKKELSGDSSSPLEEDLTNAPLYQVEKCLREKWSHFQKVKEERIEQLEDLQKRLDDVRVKLGKKDLSPHSGGITDIDLEALKCRISLLEQERDRLQATFEETRATILKIFEDLEMTPSLAFDKLVVSTPSGFVLSPENMSALKKLHQTMEQKLLDSKDYATVLRERLSNLWERLQISPDHREAFLHAYRGYSHPTICALKQELSKCEALKRANIENFVRKLREEIVSWWDRCCFSKEQREEFQAFFYTDFNEDVLEMHELEVNKLREYYEKYRDIFQLAERRGELWSKMLELEGRANDPNRLFNNRGGQLLREERERNAISKALPKIEMELKDQLLAYQQERGTPFLIDGENLLDVINQQNEERYGMKELQKQQKKVTRNHQLEVESKLGSKPVTPTSYKRGGKLCPSTPCQSVLGSSQKTLTIFATRSAPPRTVTASTKRKADLSPHCNVSKKSKGGRKSTEKRSSRSGNKSGPRYSTSKVRRFGKGASKMLQVSASKTRRNILNQLPVPVDNCSIASRVGPYSEFQNQLELMSMEKACRSSVVPLNCPLRERNTPVKASSSKVSSTTKLTLTPGRITSATHLTVTPGLASLSVTPMKPPRRNGPVGVATPVPVRRTSTRLNLKSPSIKSPASTNARLTTPRSRLPIVF